jgi:hypothetical protein
MGRKRRQVVGAMVVGLVGSGAALFLQCAPAEDTSVTIVTKCDVAALNEADPAEATVKLYAQTSADLTDRVTKLTARFTQICNAINKDLGLPEGAEIHEACNRIADRVAAANNVAPTPDGGTKPVWVSVNYDVTCPLDSAAVATCTDLCSDKKGCDPVATCPPGQKRGTCAGDCAECSVDGTPGACKGACFGSCDMPSADAGVMGLPACQGSCRGTCKSPNWLGSCSKGCGSGFRGTCAGTCTGACDGVPYPPGTPDPDAGGGDAGDGGDGGEAGAPPGSGTCNGVCTGACMGEASGSCVAPCQGDFKGGACPGVGNCVGSCDGVGVACVTTCNGTCKSASAACAGTCTGECKGTLSNGKCAASPDCGANPICAGVCALRGAIATTCAPSAVDIRVGGDYKLPTALQAHAADFSAAAREANLLSNNLSGVLQRTPQEFRAIGVVRDNARFCATEAPAAYEELRKQINVVIGASLVVSGAKF